MEEATNYKVIALGSVAAASLEPLVVSSDVKVLDAGNVRLQVEHAAAAAPTVDVHVTAPDEALSSALAFPNFTDYVGVAPDTYNVKVAAAADNSVVVIDADLTLDKGVFYSVLELGSLGSNTIEPLVLTDMPRRIATEA